MVALALAKPWAASEWEASWACAGCISLEFHPDCIFQWYVFCLFVCLTSNIPQQSQVTEEKCVVAFLWNLFSQTLKSLQSCKWLLHANTSWVSSHLASSSFLSGYFNDKEERAPSFSPVREAGNFQPSPISELICLLHDYLQKWRATIAHMSIGLVFLLFRWGFPSQFGTI